MRPCFEAQGNTSLVDIQTYLYYIQLKASRPSEGVWVPYNDEAENTIREDFKRLWATNFLDNLSIDVEDYTFSNGVVGKLVTYDMEERQRVKIVDFVGSKKLETSKIDEKLKENNAQIRLDTFIDPALIRKIEGIIRDMMKEKGFQSAEVTHEIKRSVRRPEARACHLQHERGTEGEDPSRGVHRQHGYRADGTLKRRMKDNREHCVPVVHHRTAASTRKRSSRKTPSASWSTTAIAATSARRWASPKSRCSATPRTRRRAGSSCASRSRKGTATRCTASTWRATPS